MNEIMEDMLAQAQINRPKEQTMYMPGDKVKALIGNQVIEEIITGRVIKNGASYYKLGFNTLVPEGNVIELVEKYNPE